MIWKALLVVLALCACSSAESTETETQAVEPNGDQCPHEPGQACQNPPPAMGCDDLHPFEVPPLGGCLWIADALWGKNADNIACFELTPDNGVCTRQCAGYLEIRNPSTEPLRVNALANFGYDTARHVNLGDAAHERCQAMTDGVTYASPER